MPDITQTDRAAFWRDLWALRGHHATPIVDVGFKPHQRPGPHPEYASPWHPDDSHRESNRLRREARAADAHPLDGGW